MEETINLEEIFETLRKHLVTIIISMFAGLAISGIVTFFILTPKYSSQAQLIVTLPQSDTANVNDVNTNLQMINTYKDMIVSDLVLNEVKDRLETEDNVKMTAGQIKDAISVNQSQNSQMFSIQAISTNAVTAQQIANTTSQVFQENAKDVMNVDKISIISGAVANTTPVSPNNKLNLVIGLVLGMMVGVGLAFLFELLDRTVKDEKYVTDALGFPILGTVPEMSAKELNAGIRKKEQLLHDQKLQTINSPITQKPLKSLGGRKMARTQKQKAAQTHAVSLITLTNPSSPIAEQYRTIRTNIQFASAAGQQIKTIVVTSSGPGEGKSTTAANIAVVFAKSGQRVLLVDADLRKPVVYKTFQLNNARGLSTALSSSGSVADVIQRTPVENLSILPSGPKPPNPSELLSSPRMDQILDEARQLFDVVIFDMPPVVAVTDAQIMSSKTDGTLLVVRENTSRKESLNKAKELLEMVQARVLGVVYNGAEHSKDAGYYYGN